MCVKVTAATAVKVSFLPFFVLCLWYSLQLPPCEHPTTIAFHPRSPTNRVSVHSIAVYELQVDMKASERESRG